MLLSILESIKRENSKMSKSNRLTTNRKRKRATKDDDKQDLSLEKELHAGNEPTSTVLQHLVVGFNATTRFLEESCSSQRLNASIGQDAEAKEEREASGKQQAPSKSNIKNNCNMAIVFIPTTESTVTQLHNAEVSFQHAHFPTLCTLATLADSPTGRRPRVIPLRASTSLEAMKSLGVRSLAAFGLLECDRAAGQSLAGSVADEDLKRLQDGLQTLIDYVRTNVEPIEVPWLHLSAEAKWQGVRLAEKDTNS